MREPFPRFSSAFYVSRPLVGKLFVLIASCFVILLQAQPAASCNGSPGSMFVCQAGVWTLMNSSLSIGPSGGLPSLTIQDYTFIDGDLVVDADSSYPQLTFQLPSGYDGCSGALLILSGCFYWNAPSQPKNGAPLIILDSSSVPTGTGSVIRTLVQASNSSLCGSQLSYNTLLWTSTSSKQDSTTPTQYPRGSIGCDSLVTNFGVYRMPSTCLGGPAPPEPPNVAAPSHYFLGGEFYRVPVKCTSLTGKIIGGIAGAILGIVALVIIAKCCKGDCLSGMPDVFSQLARPSAAPASSSSTSNDQFRENMNRQAQDRNNTENVRAQQAANPMFNNY